jgi:hypothetical protein
MAKRFTDTAKWKKGFIKSLSPKMKLLWFYVLDDCDHAGIWEVDLEVAGLRIGEVFTYDEAFVALGPQIKPIGKNKWFIEDFVFFQYGKLNPNNRLHQSVITILDNHHIDWRKPLTSPLEGAKDQEQYKEQEQGQGKRQGQGAEYLDDATKTEVFELIFTDERWITDLKITHPGKDYQQAFEECYMWHTARPNPPNTLWLWRQKLLSWLSNMKTETNGKQTSTNKSTEHLGGLMEGFKRRHGKDAA